MKKLGKKSKTVIECYLFRYVTTLSFLSLYSQLRDEDPFIFFKEIWKIATKHQLQ